VCNFYSFKKRGRYKIRDGSSSRKRAVIFHVFKRNFVHIFFPKKKEKKEKEEERKEGGSKAT
jgi:hypothetical protein